MPLLELFDPTSAPRVQEMPLAQRRGALAGKTIGLLGNGKANAGVLLDEIAQRLGSVLGGVTFVRREKGAADPAPAAIMERMRGCDAVITAIAD
jgi:hypothetical protein